MSVKGNKLLKNEIFSKINSTNLNKRFMKIIVIVSIKFGINAKRIFNSSWIVIPILFNPEGRSKNLIR